MMIHKALQPRDDVDRLFVSGKGGSEQASIQDSIETIRRLHKKAQRETDYNHQKQYTQHKHQQNKIKQETNMGRKFTVWMLQVTSKINLSRENLDLAKKEKP